MTTLPNNLEVDLRRRRLCVKGSEVELSYKEFSLLVYFLNHPGQILSRANILESVWDSNIFCATNTVDVHVSNLRKKLREGGCDTRFIRTVHCVGYMFDV